MAVKVKETDVGETTEGAPEGPLPRVDPNMAVQAALVRKDRRAEGASKGLVARVNTPVDAQVGAGSEALPAVLARVGPVPGVYAQMDCQAGFSGKGFAAVATVDAGGVVGGRKEGGRTAACTFCTSGTFGILIKLMLLSGCE